jgi:acyl-CoA dehydrogenase
MKMLGWRTSHTGELVFDGVRLPDEQRLGGVGEGFAQITANFAWERLAMSLGAVAGAQGALDVAIAYAREREAFGRPIAGFQVWRHRFADLATRIAMGRALAHRALRLVVAAERGPGQRVPRGPRCCAPWRWRSCSPSGWPSTSPTSACRSTAARAT